MLYGFRKEMQLDLAREGYNFCTYLPFGNDWYGYFMRRLAERPQNVALVTKQVFNKNEHGNWLRSSSICPWSPFKKGNNYTS